MTARTYPDEPLFPADRGAERLVWEALRAQLPDDAVVFHGVDLQELDVEAEIDLLVAWPGFGVAAIEVKGGYVTRTGGRWFQAGADGARRPIDPVAQVQRARHALTDLLRGAGLAAADAPFVHLVAFPFADVPADHSSPDLPRNMVIDRRDLDRTGGAAERVATTFRLHGRAGGTRPLDERAVAELVDYLGGAFPSQVESLFERAQHEARVERLTRDQGALLDALRLQRRMRVVGGAGTGKTWLALEQARRKAKEGKRVALVCYSRGLGRYLERQVATWRPSERPAFVGLFHDLPRRWGAEGGRDDDPQYWEETLPRALGELAAQQPAAELFDAVVVDEAQDFGAAWWPSLLRCLRDPENGGLFVFMDDDQRVFPRDGQAPVQLDPVLLDENLRSTKQIAQTFGALSDGAVRPRGLPGAPVRVVDVAADDAVSAADDAVEALLDEGFDPGEVALLTTGHRHPQQVEEVTRGGWAPYWDGFFAGEDVFYGHVLGFKGLERPAVVLAVNGFQDEARARKMLYTGMSRARSLLVLVGPRGDVERIGGEAARRRLASAEPWVPAQA